MADEIRVLVVDDSATVRHYLTTLIDDAPGMRVVGVAQNGQTAVKRVTDYAPDVVSMDVNMPGMDGLTATR